MNNEMYNYLCSLKEYQEHTAKLKKKVNNDRIKMIFITLLLLIIAFLIKNTIIALISVLYFIIMSCVLHSLIKKPTHIQKAQIICMHEIEGNNLLNYKYDVITSRGSIKDDVYVNWGDYIGIYKKDDEVIIWKNGTLGYFLLKNK